MFKQVSFISLAMISQTFSLSNGSCIDDNRTACNELPQASKALSELLFLCTLAESTQIVSGWKLNGESKLQRIDMLAQNI